MKKFILSLCVALMTGIASYAQVNGPFLKDDVQTSSVGFQVENKKLFLNYVNDGRDWFAISKPGSLVPNVDRYLNGALSGTRYVEVVTTNGTETRYAVGVEKTLVVGDIPMSNYKYSATLMLLTPGYGGVSFDALQWSRNGQVGLRLGFSF